MPEDDRNLPITVDDIDNAPSVSVATEGDRHVSLPDLYEALAKVSVEKAAVIEELEETKKRIRTIEILDQLIEPMAKSSFRFMCSYCGVVGTLVALHGFRLGGFNLPESVLQFLVGSTAATVIGLVGMVLTGIFVGARTNGKD